MQSLDRLRGLFLSVSPLVLSIAVVATGAPLRGEDAPSETQQTPVPVGNRKQLLVDDYVVAEVSNLQRELGGVVKLNGGRPLLVRDEPWEQHCTFFGTALHDGKSFRMWYRTAGEKGPLAYAESEDGVHWVKPRLGLVEINGSKENNIVDVELGLAYAFSCFIDPHESDPAHKYKCCWGHPRKIRACLGHSPDGLRWTPYHDGEPVTHRAADTHSQLLWDEGAGVYRLLTRTDYQQRLDAEMEVRGHRIMTNPDVKGDPTNWKLVREWLFDREPQEYRRRQVYSMTDWIYEGVHFGLVTVFEHPDDNSEGPPDFHKRHERNVLAFYLATSRNGEDWDFRWVYGRQPLVPRGPDGSFDKDMIIPPSNIITHADRHWIYYAGVNERHGVRGSEEAIGGATLRLDGFVALVAGAQPGTALTKPFKLAGDRLEINADAKGGTIHVEILDAEGEALADYSSEPVNSDGLRIPVEWQNAEDLSALAGQVVRLRLTLQDAKLYAFQLP
ncbi:MAG: hypothetical protein DWQ34_17960 [Planctomycetota bacterium]|nr:MAG: hypothetical protein DWQ29_10725 [Planctomycetota bacterium]REJ90167.1 MAG: hypothetical protein DWQ34_17960 [Planctomycetota bacterium]REK20113.1 MAG: hypothetical protein DWQ41_26325 [Planctomycetota bacterium]REK34303.1 MAG: hypothetical protein DWQ45_13560 [Planctomycetota bacterium]